ncbi:DUF922 domain-containing protein [Winogradskyella eckloniae]|uniref:DUF922 domain-containing protein n=1 Tax=Winogradskyella eckloniae TaxID=1089306 RepID=UPI001563C117|nr:DUF922 domain-containing protein [Winogradskyella eckloniae]NRD20584.1 DUF922 domain-containing protein [Winogradskyella eckloniae]
MKSIRRYLFNPFLHPLKNILICLFVLFISSETNEETLTWDAANKLTWADFKAKPDYDSDAVALTASGITFGYGVKTSGKRIVEFSSTVETHFYPNKSWYKKEESNVHILRHEQLHFDITELYSRKLRQQITKLQVNQNIKKQLNQLHEDINVELSATQAKYDQETQHSIDAVKQRAWSNFIEKELKLLDAFKS